MLKFLRNVAALMLLVLAGAPLGHTEAAPAAATDSAAAPADAAAAPADAAAKPAEGSCGGEKKPEGSCGGDKPH